MIAPGHEDSARVRHGDCIAASESRALGNLSNYRTDACRVRRGHARQLRPYPDPTGGEKHLAGGGRYDIERIGWMSGGAPGKQQTFLC
jgi:hypothetical protein